MRAVAVVMAVVLGSCSAAAQRAPDSLAAPAAATARDSHRLWWAASGAALAVSLAADARMRSVALANQTGSLDRIADAADFLGTARHLVPALAAGYATARLAGRRDVSSVILRVGLAYAAADVVESALKPLVGRARPNTSGGPLRFHPLTGRGDFHSFPSAHVVHVTAVATAAAAEADRPWVTAAGITATVVVGAQRVYRNQHWTSDVVASSLLGVAVARKAMDWLRSRD
jgi:membrane-associated phospholipid phosphatase